jgi:hypothetical protein
MLRKKQEELMNHAGCLNLVTNTVLGTQVVATLIAVYVLFMAPIGWNRALLVWGYALAWFLVNDRLKLIA